MVSASPSQCSLYLRVCAAQHCRSFDARGHPCLPSQQGLQRAPRSRGACALEQNASTTLIITVLTPPRVGPSGPSRRPRGWLTTLARAWLCPQLCLRAQLHAPLA